MFWSNANLITNAVWAVFDSIAITITLVWGWRKARSRRNEKAAEQIKHIEKLEGKIEKIDVAEAVNKQLESFEGKFDCAIGDIKEVLSKINYAIFNAGKTGLVNKVDAIMEKQQDMSEDIAVLKARRQPRG